MRELKVRVWDRLKKQYVHDLYTLSHLAECSTRGFIYIGANVKDYPFIIEQYTGLKDKNGKEIYEGDIVLDYYDGDDAFIVEWDNDIAGFRLTDTDNIISVSFDNFNPDKDLEIIGNIHENPELIGKEKE